MKNVVRVAMADVGTAQAPDYLLTIGLGSCVGITLYDPAVKVGGMAHIMLPHSRQRRAVENPAKYADTAIPLLIDALAALGAKPRRIEAKLAGGAQMFSSKGGNSEILQVGPRNVEAVRKVLESMSIKVVAQDVGGRHGRTIEFATVTGSLRIKTITKGEKVI